ncbi:MAG: hypothetical protein JST62_09670 [Bacteroidetes bacterium]|nr:hypothetical protein [Bacteroidota bacterium]
MGNKIIFALTFVFSILTIKAQEVYLRKIYNIEKEQKDKFLYSLEKVGENSKILGELEVIGNPTDTQELFKKIYNKAKEIGANTYSIKRFENVDGGYQEVDLSHFKLNLYNTPTEEISQNNGMIYIVSDSKSHQIRINNDNVTLQENTYFGKKLLPSESITISTKKLLGSTIRYTNSNQENVYFQISGFSIKANGVINLKSGDVTKLDTSYGQFLVSIFQPIQL